MSDRASWTQRHQTAEADVAPPSPFVADALAWLGTPTAPACAVDLACGRGRHALALAHAGYAVLAVDWSVPALRHLRAHAHRAGLGVDCLAADAAAWTPPAGRYACVLSTNFLERPALARMRDAVAPGGVLLLETFLDGQQRHGHPRNPDYLLHPGELTALCDGWQILRAHEGRLTRDGTTAMMAGILARRP